MNTSAYLCARQRYADLGVDTELALQQLAVIPVSLHCWQGDDVVGFENSGAELGGGLAVTGCYPGRARTVDELRADIDKALSLIPGKHRVNLHASYGEFGGRKVERNQVGPEHFTGWIDWAKSHALGLDFNPTFFAHPKAEDGATLSHRDPSIRQFWIEHGSLCRRIAASMGRALGTRCVTNVWIPDGSKDSPSDRRAPRERLLESLDLMFAEELDRAYCCDALEAKLFGIGSESYVVGSHEFYLGYAITRQKLLCLDTGHFHPTETVSEKISSVLPWVDEILLHVSRGVRWDSDHVVTFNDELQAIAQEAVRGGYLPRIHFGLDYFDASINRVAGWIIGTRNLLKALLFALLEPQAQLRAAEANGDYTTRLALTEELKTMPFGLVWDEHCERSEVPIGHAWLNETKRYERDVLVHRREF